MQFSAERYQLDGEIARGGMGVVLRVKDRSLDRTLAMKRMLSAPDADSGEATAAKFGRFLEEAQITAQLDHPAIVPVHELGTDAEGATFYTMKLVRGRELGEVFALARKGAGGWNTARALGVIVRVCQAVAYAHGKGVVHRDLKPANVMVGDLGEVYVMDWGLAKMAGRDDLHDIRLRLADAGVEDLQTIALQRDDLGGALDEPLLTMDGAVIGTPTYMAPEQAAGRISEVDQLSDLYSLGAILYELLTGQPPYMPAGKRTTAREVLSKVLVAAPERVRAINSNADPELSAICEKAMARDRSERYATAVDLAEDLQAYLDGRVVAAYERGALAEMRKWVRRNRATAIAGAAAVVAAVAGLGATVFIQSRAAEKQRVLFEKEQQAKRRAVIAVADSYAALGARAAEDGDFHVAQLWFTEAAALCGEQPVRERLNRTRAREYARRAVLPVRVWRVTGGKPGSVEFSPRVDFLAVRQGAIRKATLFDVHGDRAVEFDAPLVDVVFHPDGERIAVVFDERVEIRKLADSAVEATISARLDPGRIKFSPDGRWLSLFGNAARVWDVANGRMLDAEIEPDIEASGLIFDSGGTRVLFYGPAAAALYSLPSGGRLGGALPSVAWKKGPAPEFLSGDRVITYPSSTEFAVWSAVDGANLLRVKTDGIIYRVANGARVLARNGVYSVEDGKVCAAMDHDLPTGGPDGLRVYTNAHTPQMRDTETGENPVALPRHPSKAFPSAVSRDSTLVATLGLAGIVQVSRVAHPVNQWLVDSDAPPVFSPDSRTYALAPGGRLRVYSVAGVPSGDAIEIGEAVKELAFSPDGDVLFLRCARNVQAWNWRERRRIFSTALPDESEEMTVSPDGRRAAILCGGRQIVMLDTVSGAVAPFVEADVESFLFTGDSAALMLQKENQRTLPVLEVPSSRERFPAIPLRGPTKGMTVFGDMVAVWMLGRMGGDQPFIFNTKTGEPVPCALDHDYSGMTECAEFSEDGSLLLVSGFLPVIKLWNWRAGTQQCPDIPGGERSTAKFIRGTPWIMTAGGSIDGTSVNFWDRGTGRRVAPGLAMEFMDGRSLTISADGRTACLDYGRSQHTMFDLSALHVTDDGGLTSADLSQLASLNSGQRVQDGGLVMLSPEELAASWADFRRRLPAVHEKVMLPTSELIRWHAAESRNLLRGKFYKSWHAKEAMRLEAAE